MKVKKANTYKSSMFCAVLHVICRASIEGSSQFRAAMLVLSFLFLVAVAGCVAGEMVWNGTCPLRVGTPCPDTEFIRFSLYTSSNPTTGQTLDIASDNITLSNFNATNPTKIILHGFWASEFSDYMVAIKTAYFNKGEHNIIMVDWSKLAPDAQCYIRAALNIRHVGNCTAQLIQRIRSDGVTDIHVIGHSLGAQTANFIAKHVTPILPRITGLDPAGPFFTAITSPDDQLDKSDASFVDVIHTNMALFGKLEECGDVDFYLNGGTYQPGCGLDAACSHDRSGLLFAESISSATGFYGHKCTSLIALEFGFCPVDKNLTVLMGDNAPPTTTGVIGVPTGSTSPYAMGLK